MDDVEKTKQSQLINSISQKLTQTAKIGAKGLIFSSIVMTLVQIFQSRPEVARAFVAGLAPNILQDVHQENDIDALVDQITENLTKQIEVQLEETKLKGLTHKLESAQTQPTEEQEQEIEEKVIRPILQQNINATGSGIGIATDHSQVLQVENLEIHLVFPSLPHSFIPTLTPINRTEIERLLERNPVEKIVDFEDEADEFREIIEAPTSHIVLVKTDSGCGKSYMLYRFMHICEELQQNLYSYVNCADGKGLSEIVSKIAEHTGLITKDSNPEDLVTRIEAYQDEFPQKKCVLLFDQLDKAPTLIDEIIEYFLDPIRYRPIDNLIVVMASNHNGPMKMLSDWDDSPDLDFITRYQVIKPWGIQEKLQCAYSWGFTDWGEEQVKDLSTHPKTFVGELREERLKRRGRSI